MNQISQKALSVNKWILYTCVGWTIGILLIILSGILLETIRIEIGGQSILGIGMGLGVGLMQWLALRKHSETGKMWIWFLFIGLSIPFIFLDVLSAFIELKPENYILIATAFGGLFTGWLQYRFILSKISDKAKSWIIYSSLGWIVSTLVTMSLFWLNLHIERHFAIPLAFIFILIGGPLLGLITGYSIVSILERG